MSVLHILVCVGLGPATTLWEITPAFAHLSTCGSTESTTAWVGRALKRMRLLLLASWPSVISQRQTGHNYAESLEVKSL